VGGQSLPAVGAADEFVGQAQLELRMAGEVAEGFDAQPLRVGGAHG
jgi:hypothetical protein